MPTNQHYTITATAANLLDSSTNISDMWGTIKFDNPLVTVDNRKVIEAAEHMKKTIEAIFGDSAMLHSKGEYKLQEAYKKLCEALEKK